jgi:hypothetical protein
MPRGADLADEAGAGPPVAVAVTEAEVVTRTATIGVVELEILAPQHQHAAPGAGRAVRSLETLRSDLLVLAVVPAAVLSTRGAPHGRPPGALHER